MENQFFVILLIGTVVVTVFSLLRWIAKWWTNKKKKDAPPTTHFDKSKSKQIPKPDFSTPLPQKTVPVPEPFDYNAESWKNLSQWYRKKKSWICEICGLDLNGDYHFLDTHHVRGTRYNNPKDLKALCIGCHAEQPGEQHLKLIFSQNDQELTLRYQAFMIAYGPEWHARFQSYLKKSNSV